MEASGANTGGVVDLAGFLKSLAEEGRAVVSPEPLTNGDHDDALATLRSIDQLARDEFALDVPAFSGAAAHWAARLLYQLCQFTVCRDISEERIIGVCSTPCPEPRGPEADWSADLVLRHLPRLFQLARHLSNADPLLRQMKLIAAAWPLSSVGIPGVEHLQLNSFIEHPALRRLYADRILASGDPCRLGDPRLDDLLRADLGVHREIAPVIASKLFSNQS